MGYFTTWLIPPLFSAMLMPSGHLAQRLTIQRVVKSLPWLELCSPSKANAS